MELTPNGGRSVPGPAEWLTGSVFLAGIRDPGGQSALGCAQVRFTPGARAAWHRSPGQTLYLTDGTGLVSMSSLGIQGCDPAA